MPKTKRALAVPVDQISQTILVLRGHRVLLDAELASLYGVTTKRLNEQAKRNAERFPADFMFQLTAEESSSLRSQFATSNTARSARGGRRSLPYAFTEHGAIQAANVQKLAEHDDAIAAILSAIRELMNPPVPKRGGIGFTAML
jgi:hypothetical protein